MHGPIGAIDVLYLSGKGIHKSVWLNLRSQACCQNLLVPLVSYEKEGKIFVWHWGTFGL